MTELSRLCMSCKSDDRSVCRLPSICVSASHIYSISQPRCLPKFGVYYIALKTRAIVFHFSEGLGLRGCAHRGNEVSQDLT